MTVEDIETDSLPGLTADVLRIAAGLDPDRLLWFRGIQCDRFELLPKIMRDGKDIERVFEREILSVPKTSSKPLTWCFLERDPATKMERGTLLLLRCLRPRPSVGLSISG